MISNIDQFTAPNNVMITKTEASGKIHPSPRGEPTVPSHIAKVPFGATKGRSEDREREISRGAVHGVVSFGAVRPPRR